MTLGIVKVLKSASVKQTHTANILIQNFPNRFYLRILFFSFKYELMENSLTIAVLFLRVTVMEARPLIEVGTGGHFWILMTASQAHWVATISQSYSPPSANLPGPCAPSMSSQHQKIKHIPL